MDTDISPALDADSPAPQDSAVASSSLCSATTGKGERCKARALRGRDVCRLHAMTPQERSESAARAAARSAEVRAGVVEEREHQLTQARLGLKALLAQKLEEDAEAIATRLRDLALSTDDATALRGMQLWLDRVYGRAIQPTRDDTPTVAGSLAELEAMSLEELSQLARGLPTDPEAA